MTMLSMPLTHYHRDYRRNRTNSAVEDTDTDSAVDAALVEYH